MPQTFDNLIDKATQQPSRHAGGLWLAGQLRDNRISQTQAEDVMASYAMQVRDNGSHPYTDREALSTLRSIYKTTARQPTGLNGEHISARVIAQRKALSRIRGTNTTKSTPESVTNSEEEQEELSAIRHSLAPLANTPGATYLLKRGIDVDLASRSGVKYCADLPNQKAKEIRNSGREALVFAICNAQGKLVAIQARYIDRKKPKCYNTAHISNGAYATPGALDAHPTVLVESPINALSLAACGLPAIAVCGCILPSWIPELLEKQAQTLGSRYVLVATDNDEAGDKATSKWANPLNEAGAKYKRLSLKAIWPGCNDWNDVLVSNPEELRTVIEGQVIPRPIEEGNAYDQYGYYHPAWDRMLDLKDDIAIAPAKVQNWLQEHQ